MRKAINTLANPLVFQHHRPKKSLGLYVLSAPCFFDSIRIQIPVIAHMLKLIFDEFGLIHPGGYGAETATTN